MAIKKYVAKHKGTMTIVNEADLANKVKMIFKWKKNVCDIIKSTVKIILSSLYFLSAVLSSIYLH